MRRIMLLFCLLCCILPVAAQEMTAEEAYQEVLRRIEAARVSGATELDLSHLPITELPLEVTHLINLRVLRLNHTRITSLPIEIAYLTHLKALYLDHTPLQRLPVEVGWLNELQTLSLTNTTLTFPSPEILQRGTPEILVYLADFQSPLIWREIFKFWLLSVMGGLALLILGFRWRQRSGIEKKKRV